MKQVLVSLILSTTAGKTLDLSLLMLQFCDMRIANANYANAFAVLRWMVEYWRSSEEKLASPWTSAENTHIPVQRINNRIIALLYHQCCLIHKLFHWAYTWVCLSWRLFAKIQNNTRKTQTERGVERQTDRQTEGLIKQPAAVRVTDKNKVSYRKQIARQHSSAKKLAAWDGAPLDGDRGWSQLEPQYHNNGCSQLETAVVRFTG